MADPKLDVDHNVETLWDAEQINYESEKIPLSPYAILLTFFAGIGGLLFGYDTGIISGAMLTMKEEFNLDTVQQEFIVGGLTLGAIFGGLAAGLCSDIFGRKPVIMTSSVIFTGSALIMAFAKTYGVLLAGRFLVGFAVGLASMVIPVYIGEIAPRRIRGTLIVTNVLLITGGQLLANIISYAAHDVQDGWRYTIGCAGIPSMIQFFGMLLLPESPRHLIRKGRIEQAKQALQKIIGKNVNPRIIDFEISSIRSTLSDTARLTEVFKKENIRPLIIAVGLQIFQQLSGINTAMYYSATILKMAGFDSNASATWFSIFIAASNVTMTAVAMYLIDKVGRRRILLYTITGMAAFLTLLGVAFYYLLGIPSYFDSCAEYGAVCAACISDDRCGFYQNMCVDKSKFLGLASENCGSGRPWSSWLALASIIIYVGFYALGLGNIPWVVQSEIFPLSIRGKASGIATAANWIFNLIISMTFLSLTQSISQAGTFWLYGGIACLGWLFVYFLLPETKGKSLEEIRGLFSKKMS
ncbi:general substrate transporter [Basidiobolus meristosporus CBS 931.73]|uniref:General substrate transporter n=1 Tax=Basidiobolus meristosporus CBS 931.73 TaxID=1314790 RepID=A0A1Y1YQV7_9FUNG|nr:general substrate transporter [Basidiobolus meristosporus CBS 931.73]|eukprot:ORY00194.1 general substrate transporter [Basidiobolus meristosporus CBS 931.73]